jgi:hypothetical protein
MSLPVEAGVCRVRLELAQHQIHWDERLEGSLVFDGGQRDQYIAGAALILVPDYSNSDSAAPMIEVELVRPVIIPAGETRSFPFRMHVRSEFAFFRTMLTARIWVPFPVAATRSPLFHLPVHVREPVRVLPGKAFVRTAELLAEVSALFVQRWTPLVVGDGIAAHLLPMGPAHEAFDWIRLGWSLRTDVTRALIVVNRREFSREDVLKAMAGADRQEFQLRIDPEHPDATREQFRKLLEPFYPRPTEVRSLPIASEGPAVDPAHLPRPGYRPKERE